MLLQSTKTTNHGTGMDVSVPQGHVTDLFSTDFTTQGLVYDSTVVL